MLRETYRISDFDRLNLFDRFLEVSRMSNVPKELIGAASAVGYERPARGIETPDDTMIEMGFRLTQHRFPSADFASYALFYGVTVSSFKQWDGCNNEFGSLKGSYTEFRARLDMEVGYYQTVFDCSGEEVLDKMRQNRMTSGAVERIEEELALARKFSEGLENLEGICRLLESTAKLSARALLGVEQAAGRRRFKRPTLKDLAGVRVFMEEYFSNPQNVARIVLLAQNKQR